MISSVSRRVLLLLLLGTALPLFMAGQQESYVPGKGSYATSIYDTSFQKALFQGSFDISKHHISGLFFIKRMPEKTFRIVFTNELGMKFFDLEIGNTVFIVHFCYPSLNKKALLKLLGNDFRLLLLPVNTVIRMKRLGSKDPSFERFGVRTRGGDFYYTYFHETGKICRIQTSKTLIGKTDLRVEYSGLSLPHHIALSNPTVRLHIRLTLLNN